VRDTGVVTTLALLDAYLADLLHVNERHSGDPNGILVPSERSVRCIGIALDPPRDPPADPSAWLRLERLDALWLHRPFRLDPSSIPRGIGVIAHHRSFDERLTLGHNPALARELELHDLEPFGERDGAPLGMIGRSSASAEAFVSRARDAFGGLDALHEPPVPRPSARGTRVAVVNAMTDALVRDAAARGVTAYVTGQYRTAARRAVQDSSMTVLEVGHARSERWGARTLARVLEERFTVTAVLLEP
jgi:putative NIF3 family GTP cyclohydrolase 1 type 2